MENAESQVLEL